MRKTIFLLLLILTLGACSIGTEHLIYIQTDIYSTRELYVYFDFVILHADRNNVQHNAMLELGIGRQAPYFRKGGFITP